jgi:hypothetical protein
MQGERQHQKHHCGFYFRQQQIEENSIFQNIVQIHHELASVEKNRQKKLEVMIEKNRKKISTRNPGIYMVTPESHK